MDKPIGSALLILLMLAVSAAATHNGDGSFGLFVNQSIGSHTGYIVVLVGIGSCAGPSGGTAPCNATYLVEDIDGTVLATATLAANQTYNASFPGHNARISKSVLSVTLKGFGYGEDPGGLSALYATTKVSSADFQFYPPSLNVTSVTVWQRKYDATVFWTANDGSNGTAFVYDAGGGLVNSSGDSVPSESHQVFVGGLQPARNYTFMVEACDLSCVDSPPLQVTTLGGEDSSANPAGGSGVLDGTANTATNVSALPAAPDTQSRGNQSYRESGFDDALLFAGLFVMSILSFLAIRSGGPGAI